MDWSKSKNKKLRYSKFLVSIISIVHHYGTVLLLFFFFLLFFSSIAFLSLSLPFSLLICLDYYARAKQLITTDISISILFFICYCCSCFQVSFYFLIIFFLLLSSSIIIVVIVLIANIN